MPDEHRPNSTVPGPDVAGKDAAAPDMASADFESPEGSDGESVERSLEERIEEALSSLSELLEQADPFGELAAAAARAAGKEERAAGADAIEPPTDSEADAGGVAGDEAEFEAVSDEAFEPVAAAEAEEVDATEPTAAAEVAEVSVPDPEESIETIESLLGEVEAALGEDGSVGVEAEAVEDSVADSELANADESALLAAALDDADEAEPMADDGLPEPSLEAELAHEDSLAAAYDDADAVLESIDDLAGSEIAAELEAIDEVEGIGAPVAETETCENSDSAGAEAFDEPVDEAEPTAAPVAVAEPDGSKPAADRAEEKKPKKNAKPEKAAKPKKEPLLVRLRPRVVGFVQRVCTAMSGPMTLVPVSMRDPVGAIAAFTLVNALLVWVLVLVLR